MRDASRPPSSSGSRWSARYDSASRAGQDGRVADRVAALTADRDRPDRRPIAQRHRGSLFTDRSTGAARASANPARCSADVASPWRKPRRGATSRIRTTPSVRAAAGVWTAGRSIPSRSGRSLGCAPRPRKAMTHYIPDQLRRIRAPQRLGRHRAERDPHHRMLSGPDELSEAASSRLADIALGRDDKPAAQRHSSRSAAIDALGRCWIARTSLWKHWRVWHATRRNSGFVPARRPPSRSGNAPVAPTAANG